jgi:hypothetical protein
MTRQAARWRRHRPRRPMPVTYARRSRRARRRELPTRSDEGGRRRLNNPDRVNRARQLRLCAAGRASVRGSHDVRREHRRDRKSTSPIENVPSPTARAPSYHRRRKGNPTARRRPRVLIRTNKRRRDANNPDGRSSQMRFVLRLIDFVFLFFVRPSNGRRSPASRARTAFEQPQSLSGSAGAAPVGRPIE